MLINRRALREDTPPDLEFRYIDIGTVGHGVLVTEPELMAFADAPSRARRLLRRGDTIVSTVRTYLRAIWPVKGEPADLIASTGFAVLSPGPQIDPRFLGWWTQSDVCVEEIVARSVGVSYPAINATELGNLTIDLPSLPEQREIADFLDAETARVDALVEKNMAMLDLLTERRQALITAAVTGNLDLGVEA